MSDKKRITPTTSTASSVSNKTKARQSIAVRPVTSRAKPPCTNKDRNTTVLKPKVNKNTTLMNESCLKNNSDDAPVPEFEEQYRQIAYGKFLRAMLEDCLVEEKIEQEENQMQLQICHLATRLQETISQLDKTSRRLKDVSFVVEQKRLLDMKNKDCSQFYETIERSNPADILKDLNDKEEIALDHLEVKNIDFGYNKDCGHKQLLDAVEDALAGLEEIKRHSKLDTDKLKAYESKQRTVEDIEKDTFDLEHLKKEFEKKFPSLCERLLNETSVTIHKFIEGEEDGEDD